MQPQQQQSRKSFKIKSESQRLQQDDIQISEDQQDKAIKSSSQFQRGLLVTDNIYQNISPEQHQPYRLLLLYIFIVLVLIVSFRYEQFVVLSSQINWYFNQKCFYHKESGRFQVYLSQHDEKFEKLPEIHKDTVNRCGIEILTSQHLKNYIAKWNKQHKSSKLQLDKLSKEQKTQTLIFLRLYYNAGIYLNMQIPLENIQRRCYEPAIFDEDIMFGASKKLLQNGIKLPDFTKFVRARYPFSSILQNWIVKISNSQDYTQQCRNRQCFIIQCQVLYQPIESDYKYNLFNISQAYTKRIQRINEKINFEDQILNHKIQPPSHQGEIFEPLNVKVEYNIISAYKQKYVIESTSTEKQQLITNEYDNTQVQNFLIKKIKDDHFRIMLTHSTRVISLESKCQAPYNKIVLKNENDVHQTNLTLWKIIRSSSDIFNTYQIIPINCQNKALMFQGEADDITLKEIGNTLNIDSLWILEPVQCQSHQNCYYSYQQKLSNLVQQDQLDSLAWKQDNERGFVDKRLKQKNGVLPYWRRMAEFQADQNILPQDSDQLMPCAKNHIITYIWLGTSQIRQKYKEVAQRCKQNVRILGDADFNKYVELWNNEVKEPQIIKQQFSMIERVDLLKMLFLYFQGGIYSDFDTQINQKCWQLIYTEDIIWAEINRFYIRYKYVYYPQQNFMMVKSKFNPQVKQFATIEIKKYKKRRWDPCVKRQCLIMNCQRHYSTKSYKLPEFYLKKLFKKYILRSED